MNALQRQVLNYMTEALEQEDAYAYVNEAWAGVQHFVMDSLADAVFDQHSVEIDDVVECTNGLTYKILEKNEVVCTMQYIGDDVVNPSLIYRGIPYNVIKTIKR